MMVALWGFRMRFLAILAVCLVSAFGTVRQAVAAPELPKLSGVVILTVVGLNPASFPGGQEQFDLDRLRALGESHIRTSTIWTEGVHDFSGVMFKDLADYLGLKDGDIKAVALNDYTVDIPVSDARPDGPILAYAIDGQPMSVRDKGPLWIIYPFDSNPDFRSEVIYTRAIWQLERFEVNR